MKRLKILCTLVLVSFLIAATQNSLTSFISGFSLGWDLGEYETQHNAVSQTHIALQLIPKSDLVNHTQVNEKDSSTMLMISDKATFITLKPASYESSTGEVLYTIADLLLNLSILACFVMLVVLLVKIILSFRRSEVFEKKNITRINRIGWCLISVGILTTVWESLHVFAAREAIALADYDISYLNVIDWEDFILGLVILLMNEILIISTGMKEEQELTI